MLGFSFGFKRYKRIRVDKVPDEFIYTAVYDVPPDTDIESENITVTGIDRKTDIKAQGLHYLINDGMFTPPPGDELNFSLTSVYDYTPPQGNNIHFSLISGYTPPLGNDIHFSLASETYTPPPGDTLNFDLEMITYTNAAGFVRRNDKVKVKLRSGNYGEHVSGILTIGGVSSTFDVHTQAA